MSRKIQFVCLFVLAGLLSTVTQLGFAQADPPLNFDSNYFVTGDYVVAGAYNMTTTFVTINGQNYAKGTITIPDTKNTGITGATSVPAGAKIVAAFLYWETAESATIQPGQIGSGQNGYFRPVIQEGGPPAPSYAISGLPLPSQSTVAWSSGGCTGTSTGKVVRVYRADV